MTVRFTYVNYKEDVAMNMMKNGEDRTASLKTAVESAIGKFLGFYGLIGQNFEVVVISDFEKQTDYMALVMSAYLGGAVSEIKTVTCWTGPELVISSKKMQEISYTVPKS